jgi:uncharacterized protein involved in oxidation of intracellular sulfur
MMKLGIIMETNDTEKVWNGLRFAVTALKQDHEVKLFLMGAGVEIESLGDAHFDVPNWLEQFHTAGGELLACGTCIKSRQMQDNTACPISTMRDCVEVVTWADKTVTF